MVFFAARKPVRPVDHGLLYARCTRDASTPSVKDLPCMLSCRPWKEGLGNVSAGRRGGILLPQDKRTLAPLRTASLPYLGYWDNLSTCFWCVVGVEDRASHEGVLQNSYTSTDMHVTQHPRNSGENQARNHLCCRNRRQHFLKMVLPSIKFFRN